MAFFLVLGLAQQSFAGTLLPPATITVPATNADGIYMVKWTKSPTVTTGITYELQESTNSTFTNPRIVPHTTVLSANITGRTMGMTYYYRVRAKKSGWATSSWQSGDTGCAVPGTTTATLPGALTVPVADPDGDYMIKWKASATPGVTYILQEATNAAFTGARTVPHADALSTKISGRTIGTTYYYRVKAVKPGAKDSAWRNGVNGCDVSPLSHTAWFTGAEAGGTPSPESPRNAYVILFLDKTHYMYVSSVDDEDCKGGGIEQGIYTWNPTDNMLTTTTTYIAAPAGYDCGLGGIHENLVVNGNTATIPSKDTNGNPVLITLDKIIPTSNPIVGAWFKGNPDPSTIDYDAAAFIFLDDSHFMLFERKDTPPAPDPDSCGHSGFEHGYYTWDQVTKTFTTTVPVDTNGCWGFASAEGGISANDGITVKISGNTLIFTDPNEGTFKFPKLSQ